jgi:tetrahydromethanopterin S-methyltransferase subunit F
VETREVDPALRETARNAWTFGLLAIGLTVLIPCSSYITALVALPLGMVAVARARAVLDGDRKVDEATEIYARTGRILGLMSAGVSGLFLAIVLLIILLYAGMLIAMFGFVAAVPPMPPPVP